MSSEAVKQSLKQQIQTEASVSNVRVLIEKIQSNCFEKCVPKPGPSLSSSESTCMTTCMEKYMNAWNHVNSTFITKLQSEGGH